MILDTDILDLFDYHAPSIDQTQDIIRVRIAMKEACAVLLAHVPAAPMRTLAIRKLEEASMWANKAIVFAES